MPLESPERTADPTERHDCTFAEDEIRRLKAVVERDRTRAAQHVEGLREHMLVHEWLGGSRGSYAYDEPGIHLEFSEHYDTMNDRIDLMRTDLRVRSFEDCPTTTDDVVRARQSNDDAYDRPTYAELLDYVVERVSRHDPSAAESLGVPLADGIWEMLTLGVRR